MSQGQQPPQLPQSPQDKIILAVIICFIAAGIGWLILHFFFPDVLNRMMYGG